jgi:AcrR family transcriptional regulator
MARTQSFDRDTVVRAARALFWRTGYESTSIPELEAATGLSRSSIYNAFGSKRGLFDAAVDSYLTEVVRPRLRPLTAQHVEPSALADYLTGLRAAFQNLESMPAANGCLLINTAGAPIADDPQVARVIADYRAELRDAVVRGLHAARGQVPAPELARLADAVTGLMIAAFAMARVDAAEAARSIDTALALLG